MESSRPSRENRPESRHASLREEGELSDDDNDEDVRRYRQKSSRSLHHDVSRTMAHAERNRPHNSSRGETSYSSQRHYRHSPLNQERYSRHVVSPRYNRHGGRKRGHGSDRSDEELQRKDRQSSNVATPSSKIWENRRFRASSVRPRTPPTKTGGPENQNELLELVREQERIREQLQSLEEEEKRSVSNSNVDGDEKGRSSDDDYILDMIEHFPSKTLGGEGAPASPQPGSIPTEGNLSPLDLDGGKEMKSSNIDMEDISDEEDFDEQKLRILALATSVRHNQLLAKGIQNKSPLVIGKDPPGKEKEGTAVVIIPDIELDTPEPEVVVVPEDEENVKKTAKPASSKKGEKTKGRSSSSKVSKDKAKSRSKKKKKGSSKQEAKKKANVHDRKSKLSTREWSQQQKLLKVLALKDPKQAIEKILRYAEEGVLDSRPAPPKLTGTMGDFKRQKHLPLLSEKQRQAMLGRKSKDRDAREKPKKVSEKKGTNDVGDNYEEVEMEITSDCEEKEATKQNGDPTLERLNLGAEFSQAMQPIPVMPYLPHHIDNSMLSSMTTYYQAPPPPLPLAPHALDTATSSSSLAPPLPHHPPPLPPLPPPPPPPPLMVSPPGSHGGTSSGNLPEPLAYTDPYPVIVNSYGDVTANHPAMKGIPDNGAYRGAQKERSDFPPYLVPSRRRSPTKSVSWKESEEKHTDVKQISIDIGSQLHRLRKEQEKAKKVPSSGEEETVPPSSSHSGSVDISKGFWSNEEYDNNSANNTQGRLKKKSKSAELPNNNNNNNHQSEDFEYSPSRDALYYGHDIVSRHDVVEYKPSPKAYTDSLELQDYLRRRLIAAQSSPSSSSSSLGRSQQGVSQRGRRSPVANLSPSLDQQSSFEADDMEKDNSDDEDELRKQLLTSLALRRLSSAVSEESPIVSPKPRETGKSDGNGSDEEPVPPPVVRRVWSTPDDVAEHGSPKPEISPQDPVVHGRLPPTPLREPDVDESNRFDSSEVEITVEVQTSTDSPSVVSAPQSDKLASSDLGAVLESHARRSVHESKLPGVVEVSTLDQQSKPRSRPSISFQVKTSRSKIQASKMKPPVSSKVATSSGSHPVDLSSSKALSSPLPSSVIKTIYSSSQSLSSLKSTLSNASVNGQKERSQKFMETATNAMRTSSPNIFTEDAAVISSHSSSSETKELAVRQQKKFSTVEVPIHPSVIVPLHTSSDEEDEDTMRASDEENDGLSAQSKIEMRKLITEEKLLLAQKKEIIADQEHLRRLLARAGEALKAQRLAEARRESVQAQIAALMEKEKAVDRMAKVQERLKDKIKTEARDVKNRLLKSKPTFLEKTKSVMGLGRSVIGPDFIPKALRAVPKLKADAEPRQLLTKSQKIAVEKQKLREKEHEIAEKLRVLKESTNSSRPMKRKATSALTQEKPSDVIRLDQDHVDVLLPRKRKRSRLSTDASKTPNLPMTPKPERLRANETMAPENNRELEGKDDTPAFQMPKSSQLSNLRKILVEEKVEKVLRRGTEKATMPGMNFYSAFNGSSKAGNLNLILDEEKRSRKSVEKLSMPASLAYSSPLKMLRSYRFSKFYRTKEALSFTSKTFSHKINPSCIMCPYDLRGTCNDDKCQQQHPKDYETSDHEILEDLVSFHPEVTGVKPDASRGSIRKAVRSYVDSFLAKHKDRLTLDEMCLLLTSEISKTVGHGQAVCTKARQWKLNAKEEKGLNIHLEHKPSFKKLQLFDFDKSRPTDKDAHIGEEDVRYFTSEGTDAMSLEEAVLENPKDIELWLHLSARKLADPNWTPRECLDQALNVLARALEANRSDPDLWLQYLILYKKHSEVDDFPQFCQTALEYAPSYELWFMYLSSLKTYHEKESACLKTLDFLCETSNQRVHNADKGVHNADSSSVQNPGENSLRNCYDAKDTKSNQNSSVHSQENCEQKKRSHRVLEMIIYYTNLNILTGRFKTAVKFLQTVLGENEANTPISVEIRNQLSVCHTLVLWMIYIHVLEWRQLPKDLFLGANENPGRIASEKLSLSWPHKAKLYTPLKTLVRLHKTAAKVWTSSEKTEKDAEEQFVWLIKSLVTLWSSQQCLDEALTVCLKVLSRSNLEDIWLTTASVYAANQSLDRVNKIFTQAVKKNEYSAKLQFYQNVFLCSQGKSEEALQSIERFIINCFDSSSQSMVHLDPNLLFCQLLNLQEGFSIQPTTSQPKPDMGTNLTKDVYVWLCYCQLLELQGEREEAVEMFERSLSHVQSPPDLVLIWQSYISFLLKTDDASKSSLAMQDLLVRSIISMPMKLPLPFSTTGASVVDFRHSNQLVEVWLSLLPWDRKLDVVEKCLDYMPGNVPLVVRGLELCVSRRETRRAFCWCKMAAAQSDKPTCLTFWKIASALAYSEGTQREVERMLMRCAQVMPLAVSAWKDLLLFEVTREEGEIVSQILSQCSQLGLNIQDYVQTLSAKSHGSFSSVAS